MTATRQRRRWLDFSHATQESRPSWPAEHINQEVRMRKMRVAASLAVTGALTMAGASASLAAPVPSGPGTGVCGPSNGSFHAAGGPGYAQYGPPPLSPVAAQILCGSGGGSA